MVYALLLSCAAPPAGDALPASAKAPPVRPFSLGLDLPAAPGAYLDRDDDHDGRSERRGDCDDTTGAISPRMDEACNLVDDDCDGAVDEGCREDWIGAWQYKSFHSTDGEVASAEWGAIYADAAGTEWCRMAGTLLVEGPGRRNCPDCIWDFEGSRATLQASGMGCDRLDIPWELWPMEELYPGWESSDTYSYGYALSGYDYSQWYNGRYENVVTEESVMLNMSLGWFTGWANFDPAGRHEVFGDGTGNEVTAMWYWYYSMPGGYTLSPE